MWRNRVIFLRARLSSFSTSSLARAAIPPMNSQYCGIGYFDDHEHDHKLVYWNCGFDPIALNKLTP